jgi:hypothetical protein
MKISLVLNALAALVICSAGAKDQASTESNLTPDQVEAKYTQAIEGRAADILKVLALTDTSKAAKVHDAVIAQYRALKAWHDENDTRLKAAKSDTNAVAQIHASLQTLHDYFLAKLSANLTPQQVDQVKDKMTYGVVQVTFNAYVKKYPDLTDAEKQQLLTWLIEARESSMDQGSSDEKHAVFGKFKGRINNYLSKQGYDAKTGRKKVAPLETPAAATSQPAK